MRKTEEIEGQAQSLRPETSIKSLAEQTLSVTKAAIKQQHERLKSKMLELAAFAGELTGSDDDADQVTNRLSHEVIAESVKALAEQVGILVASIDISSSSIPTEFLSRTLGREIAPEKKKSQSYDAKPSIKSRRKITVAVGGEISDAQSAPPLINLAIEGGGPRGLAHVGALKVLEEQGHLKTIQRVAGSSAGAITAATICSGYSSNEAQEISTNLNFFDLLDAPETATGTAMARLITECLERGETEAINLIVSSLIPGGPAIIELLEEVELSPADLLKPIINSALGIDFHSESFQQKLKKICNGMVNMASDDQRRGLFNGKKIEEIITDLLQKKVQAAIDLHPELMDLEINLEHITFANISALATRHPELGFKEIIITGTNITDKTLEIFSTETTPDMDVALATHISMAIPWVFKPVTHNGKQYMDGGCLNNFPINIFDKPPYAAATGPEHQGHKGQNMQTLGLKIDNESETRHILWNKERTNIFTRPAKWLKDSITDLVVGVPFSESERRLNAEAYDLYAQRIIQIHDQGFSLFSFDLSSTDKQKLIESGTQAATSWVLNHQGEMLPTITHADFTTWVQSMSLQQLTTLCSDLADRDHVTFSVHGGNASDSDKTRENYLQTARRELTVKQAAVSTVVNTASLFQHSSQETETRETPQPETYYVF